MDLRLRGIPPSAAERAAVDAVLGPLEAPWGGDGRHALQASHGGEALRAQRHLLLPVLHAVQDRCGWISPEALDYLCQRLAIPPAEAYGVASFYALLSVSPQPPVVAHVCDDLACLMQGAEALCADVERVLGPAGVPSPQGQATWHRSPCLGLCDRAPAVLLRVAGAPPGDQTIAPATAVQVRAACQSHGVVSVASSPVPQAGDPGLRLLRRAGVVDPTSLDAYRAHGGYAALRRALDLGPEGVLREVSEAKLLGRGGAAFPTGRKWEAVAQAPVHPHYLICNADESEPGTFKDRILMEADPCRAWAGHAGCLNLWTGAHGRECHCLGAAEAATLSLSEALMTAVDTSAARRSIPLTIDGQAVCVPEGTTLLEACRMQGIATPTLCYLENLRPVNVCRVCVVEVEGSRALVPACSRRAENGMVVQTDSERVRLSRRLVLELLASSVDLSLASALAPYLERYGVRPTRFGAPVAGRERDARQAGHHEAPEGPGAETVAQPVKIDNELYVRDYSRCVLCYKCVEACGVEAQNTFAITVAGRGFDARISTEFAVPLTDSACVYCGNCIGVCPTGALMFRSEHEMREAGTWNEAAQAHTDTICPYCGVGCTLTLHVQENQIVHVTSPLDHEVGHGHLCIKGRFGWQFVQNRADRTQPS